MNKRSIVFLIALLSVALFSCTEEVDIDLDDDYNRLVVEAFFTNDTTQHEVVLSESTSYFDNEEIKWVENATIYIQNQNKSKTFYLNESSTKPGHYYTDPTVSGEVGETYTLHIEDVDINKDGTMEDYQAVSEIKPVLTMDSVYALNTSQWGEDGFLLYGYAQELPTPGDFYMWHYYVNGVLSTDTLSELIFTDDAIMNGVYLSNFEMEFVTDAQSGDTLLIQTQSITKGYYDFIVSFMLETQWQAGPFGGPPANIKTNINNGALGYFKTSALDYYQIVMP